MFVMRCVCVIAPYVKVYLMDGKTCVEKQKTMTARRTLDPLYQQQLCFTMPYNGKILQVRPDDRPPALSLSTATHAVTRSLFRGGEGCFLPSLSSLFFLFF